MHNQAADTLIQVMTSAAHKFRLGHEADGSHDFAQCIDLLTSLLPELQNTTMVSEILSSMLTAQERHDWLALADNLEYDLPFLLQSIR